MSFLAGRLAAAEGSFFAQESKLAASRLAQKLQAPPPSSSSSAAAKNDASSTSLVAAADVLPEILRHSLPIKGASSLSEAAASPSLSTPSKWLVSSSSSSAGTVSPDSLNPLRAYVSMPQATFGPKRWQISDEHSSFSVSTANQTRHDRQPSMDPEKLKAVIAGYTQVGKAFAVATLIIFGGATALFLHIAHKLQLHSIDDIRTKGKDLLQPGADLLKEQMVPLRTWAENVARKWHFEGGKPGDKAITKELSKQLSLKRVD